MPSINRKFSLASFAMIMALSACSFDREEDRSVDASGGESAVDDVVPAEVLSAALAARPELRITETELITRGGKDYYDVGGTLTDGSEIELDMTQVDGAWTVVSFQRDIGIDLVPGSVMAALSEGVPGWLPTRIIESDKGNGTVIYEFFAEADDGGRVRHNVKWTDGAAELLVD